jgi:hypothetical protein
MPSALRAGAAAGLGSLRTSACAHRIALSCCRRYIIPSPASFALFIRFSISVLDRFMDVGLRF